MDTALAGSTLIQLQNILAELRALRDESRAYDEGSRAFHEQANVRLQQMIEPMNNNGNSCFSGVSGSLDKNVWDVKQCGTEDVVVEQPQIIVNKPSLEVKLITNLKLKYDNNRQHIAIKKTESREGSHHKSHHYGIILNRTMTNSCKWRSQHLRRFLRLTGYCYKHVRKKKIVNKIRFVKPKSRKKIQSSKGSPFEIKYQCQEEANLKIIQIHSIPDKTVGWKRRRKKLMDYEC